MVDEPRNGKVMPFSRGSRTRGGPPIPPGTTTAIEDIMPVFKTDREKQQWMAADLSRLEAHRAMALLRDQFTGDVQRLADGFVQLLSRYASISNELIVLKEQMFERGMIEPKLHQEKMMEQTGFWALLETINSSEDTPMAEKIQMARSWNTEHPGRRIAGDRHINGVTKFLGDPNSGLSLLERAEAAADLMIEDKAVLTEAEMEELTAALAERAGKEGSDDEASGGDAPGGPAGEAKADA